MNDIGALGYNRRHAKVVPVYPFWEWVTPIDMQQVDTLKWEKVEE